MGQPVAGPGVAFRAAAAGLRPAAAEIIAEPEILTDHAVVADRAVVADHQLLDATTWVAADQNVGTIGLVAAAGAGQVAGPAVEARALAISPALLAQLVAVRPIAVVESMPVEATRSGSVFHDRADAALRWYLPAFAPVDPDPSFAFDAVQAEVGEGGSPFDRATLTFDIRPIEPPDLAGARAAEPDATFQVIAVADIEAVLRLPYTDDAGQPQANTIPAILTAGADGTYHIVVDGLVGKSVVLCWTDLRVDPQATLEVTVTYRVARRIRRGPLWWVHDPALRLHRVDPTAMVATQAVTVAVAPAPPVVEPPPDPTSFRLARGVELIRLQDRRATDPEDPGDTPPDGYINGSATALSSLAIAAVYGVGQYLPDYRLTVAGHTRPIIDVHDLVEFAAARSEYRELTSLGPPGTRYPSIRRLYVGDVTGNVVAIPATYGILRGAAGCAAVCSAIVDERADTLTGCQFHLTFGLGPIVDPIELARLADDLLTTPEAAVHGRLNLMLPSGLDPRVAGTLDNPTVTSAAFAGGADPSTLLLSVAIQDGDVPAINKVNAFLSALGLAAGMSLFGQVALRLDDVFTPPVLTTVLLNLHATADGDDLLVDGAPTSTTFTVTDSAPFPLHLRAWAEHVTGVLNETAIDEVVAPGASTTLALPVPADASTGVLVRREIALDDAHPRAQLARCVTFQAQTVQQTRYVLALNGAAVDFAAIGVTEMSFRIALVDLPTIAVTPIILTPSHRIDSVPVTIPIDVVVSGLAADLSVTLQLAAGGSRDVLLHHDFWDGPILVLEQAALA